MGRQVLADRSSLIDYICPPPDRSSPGRRGWLGPCRRGRCGCAARSRGRGRADLEGGNSRQPYGQMSDQGGDPQDGGPRLPPSPPTREGGLPHDEVVQLAHGDGPALLHRHHRFGAQATARLRVALAAACHVQREVGVKGDQSTGSSTGCRYIDKDGWTGRREIGGVSPAVVTMAAWWVVPGGS